MQYRKEIEAYFDEHWFEIMKDISRICAINSERMPAEEGKPFGDGPYQALMEFGRMAAEKGFTMKTYDNVVGAIDLNDGEKQLDILAHLDVVPAGEGWTETEPFKVVLKDGRLFGRGTADDKGPAVVSLWALKAARDLGLPVTKNARLIVGTDEECGSGDLPHYYAVEKEAPMSFSPDADYPVINIEKGGLAPKFFKAWAKDETLPRLVSMKGSLKINVLPGKAYATVMGLSVPALSQAAEKATARTGVHFTFEENSDCVNITAEGHGAHAAFPETGNNALTGLIYFLTCLPLRDGEDTRALASLKKLFPHGDCYGQGLGVNMEDEISGKLTLVFSMMDWNEEGFVGQFDCRAPLMATNENLRDVALAALAAEGIKMEDKDMNPPHHVPGDSDFVKELLSVYEEYTGQEGKPLAIGGGTYVHHLENGVAFGCTMPGTDNRMHGADEFAVVDELLVSGKMFTQVIADLCK